MQKGIIIPSHSRYVASTVSAVIEFVKKRVVDIDEQQFATVLAEALINAIKHGNKEKVTKRVVAEVRLLTDRLVVAITDEGAGFDHTTFLAAQNNGHSNGNGLSLIHAFMDEVRFNGSGNRITMVRFLMPMEGHDADSAIA